MPLPDMRQECFNLFKMYPDAPVTKLSKHSGISMPTLYRYRKQWELSPEKSLCEEYGESHRKNVQIAVVVGFVIGAAFTLLAQML